MVQQEHALVKSNAERKANERERMRARGYVLKQFWVHPRDWLQVHRYLLRVNEKRQGALHD
jgi:hypothetical protein